jgi:hypothetical protein
MEFVEEQGVAIFANGSFNPSIFQPSWLQLQGIITAEEAEAATVEIIHPEIARFQVPGLQFDVQTERFVLHGAAEPFVRAADIFSITFGEKLSHTPISSAGVNYWAHVRLRDWKQRQRFGRMLAPVEPWGHFGELLESGERALAGGFSTLRMRAAYPPYGEGGAINVAVQPSVRVPDDVGVFIHVNNHFEEPEEIKINLSAAVYERFDEAVSRARDIVNHLTEIGRAA